MKSCGGVQLENEVFIFQEQLNPILVHDFEDLLSQQNFWEGQDGLDQILAEMYIITHIYSILLDDLNQEGDCLCFANFLHEVLEGRSVDEEEADVVELLHDQPEFI